MTIYLDYFRTETKDIIILSLYNDAGELHNYSPDTLDEVGDELSGTDPIVVFSRPFLALKEFLEEDDIKDWEIRKRWFDIFHKLRDETGKELSLHQVARGTLGEGPRSDIPRLPKNYSRVPSFDISEKVHLRLRALRGVYLSVLSTSILRYYYRGTLIQVSIDFDELYEEQLRASERD